MPISSDAMIALRKGLTAAASLLAERAKQKVTSNAEVPNNIAENMKVGKVESKGTGALGITISIGMKKGEAEAAAAYEFGSGLHGKEGKTYPITPKNAPVLAFGWNPKFTPWGSPKFVGIGRGGKYLFRYVDHPGVEARPYMKPAIEENKEEMKRLIGEFFTIDVIHKAIHEAWYA